MTCGHCEITVGKAIMNLGDGILNVQADKNAGIATVTFDDAKISSEEIKEAINATEIYQAG